MNTLANNRLWNKHGIKLLWSLAILLLVLVLLSVSWTAWQQTKIKQANYQAQQLAPITTNNRQTYRVSDILAANLFGDPTPAPVVKVAPKTTLDLTLVGVLWSSDNSVGRAIINSGKQASELYSLGEEIKGAGAKVEEIRDAEVILNRNGALESLPLYKLTDSSSRIVITFDDYPVESVIQEYQQDSANIDNDQYIEPINTVREATNEDDQVRRVRRPNFSGLDRALEKMGEL